MTDPDVIFVPPSVYIVVLRVGHRQGPHRPSRGVWRVNCRVLSEPLMSAYGEPFIWVEHPYFPNRETPVHVSELYEIEEGIMACRH